MKSLTIPKSKHFITIQFSINLSWQAATAPCKSYNLFALSSCMKWVLWPLIMNCGDPLTLPGYHVVQQRQQNQQCILGFQLRTKFNTEKKSKDEERIRLNPRIRDPLEKLSSLIRLRHNKYRTVKDTFTLLKPQLLSDSDQRKHFSDVQKMNCK